MDMELDILAQTAMDFPVGGVPHWLPAAQLCTLTLLTAGALVSAVNGPLLQVLVRA